MMAPPTEILARQHMESLAPLAQAAGVRVEVLTGRDRSADRAAKLADLASGAIDILVGTHAVFQKDVHFMIFALSIIDEQHRFGVAQRMELGAKGTAVDVLVMTATPIPRSLSLAQYGDMDISVIDEKPPGRTPVKTALVAVERRDEVVAHLKRAIAEGAAGLLGLPAGGGKRAVRSHLREVRFRTLRAALGEGMVAGAWPASACGERCRDGGFRGGGARRFWSRQR